MRHYGERRPPQHVGVGDAGRHLQASFPCSAEGNAPSAMGLKPSLLLYQRTSYSSISLSVKQLWLALFLTGMLGRLKETVLKKHLAEFLVGVSRQSTLAMSLIH